MNVFRPDTNLKIFLLAFCVVFFSLTAAGSAQQAVQDDQPPEPVLPAPIEAVLFAQPFRLETGYMTWPPDTPPVTSGLIVVFRADPALTIPREAPTPILYAGDQTVLTLNTGQDSGVLIGLVPEIGRLADLTVWFGAPRVAGAVDLKTVEKERSAAAEAGIRPLSADDLTEVTREETATAPNMATLLRDDISELVLEFAPEEKALAAKWRLPEVGYTNPKNNR